MAEIAQLFLVASRHKEEIFSKLHELVPERLARLDRTVFEGKTTEEVLALVYMQGVAEALDAFDMRELLRTIARESAPAKPDMQA
jgi:hypothetical protein